jgi:hypothetical protein
MVDSYSSWIDFKEIKTIHSAEIIKQLKTWFAVHGSPEELHTDNGTQYTSQQFKDFANEWNFKHVTGSPHHHQSNGLAERYVQVAKNILRKTPKEIEKALLVYRNTPRGELGSPNQRLFSRQTKSILPITQTQLKPLVVQKVHDNLKIERDKQKNVYDRNAVQRKSPNENDTVMVQHPTKKTWEPGEILQKESDRSMIVRTENGQFKRNMKLIRKLPSRIPIQQQPSQSADEAEDINDYDSTTNQNSQSMIRRNYADNNNIKQQIQQQPKYAKKYLTGKVCSNPEKTYEGTIASPINTSRSGRVIKKNPKFI